MSCFVMKLLWVRFHGEKSILQIALTAKSYNRLAQDVATAREQILAELSAIKTMEQQATAEYRACVTAGMTVLLVVKS